MDMVKIGSFLAELRKEKGLTQAELGERLGVTNKTVSRWETGNYMPPVEMLDELSKFYGLTINELLSGKKLTTEEYKEMAEANIRETLETSSFSLKEKTDFYKNKWRKDHISLFIISAFTWIAVIIAIMLKGVNSYLAASIAGILALLYYAVLNNRMMAYVEDHIYGK